MRLQGPETATKVLASTCVVVGQGQLVAALRRFACMIAATIC